MVLGQEVRAGDLLAELDTTLQRLQAQEQRSHGEASDIELRKLHQEIASQLASLEHEREAALIALQETRTRLQEAETAAAYAALEADRKAKLFRAELASDLDVARANAEREKQKATVEGLRLAIRRQEQEQKVQSNEHQSRIDALLRDASRLENEGRRSGLTLSRLQTEIALQRIIAPVDGRIGEVAALRPGSVLRQASESGLSCHQEN